MYISEQGIAHPAEGSAEGARQPRRDRQGAVAGPDHPARSLQVGHLHRAGGARVCKNGLSPFARSAFAAVPTGTPRSPLFGATKFTQRMPRLRLQTPVPMTPLREAPRSMPCFAAGSPAERNAKRLSYHNDFNAFVGDPADQPVPQPDHQQGPDGGPPARRVLRPSALGGVLPQGRLRHVVERQCAPGTKFHPNFPDQNPNSVWCYGTGNTHAGDHASAADQGPLRRADPHPHLQQHARRPRRERRLRPQRDAAALPQRPQRRGERRRHRRPPFPRHLLRLPLEHHARPARQDQHQRHGREGGRAATNGTGIVKVPGDFREIQGTMWAHDHRFFFTAENVYKGNLGMVNYYSGRDRGHETDHDRHQPAAAERHAPAAAATSISTSTSSSPTAPPISDGQYFFDIFTTDGFLGDLPLVNFAYAPVLRGAAAEVPLPHPQRRHVALLQAGAQLQRRAGALQVHRQRRQPASSTRSR